MKTFHAPAGSSAPSCTVIVAPVLRVRMALPEW